MTYKRIVSKSLWIKTHPQYWIKTGYPLRNWKRGLALALEKSICAKQLICQNLLLLSDVSSPIDPTATILLTAPEALPLLTYYPTTSSIPSVSREID